MSIGASDRPFPVAIVGAGVVGSAVALALARRGVEVTLFESQREPGLAASGTNSGIVHTGFDSVPGELETELILRSGERRDEVLDVLRVPVMRCGAVMRGDGVGALADNARLNGVEVRLAADDVLEIPGEAVTDPVAYTLALVAAAERHGAEVRLGEPFDEIRPGTIVNCAGLYADDVARIFGDESFEIYARKGEFLVFDPPEPLDRILLPVPTKRTKGVLVFPTLDGKVVAGPTAVDLDDKEDWSVRPEARDEILPKAVRMWPALEGLEPIAAYAGLRPAGRGVNYVVERSSAWNQLINVAAIRSTGLTASLGIAEYVCQMLLGSPLPEPEPLRAGPAPEGGRPWWRRTAELHAA
jgi:glycerol-3-phosphate dehydrogenase